MGPILVVNAGSSSVKFQVFATDAKGPQRLLKGQVDGIGSKPRLRAEAADKTKLIDQTYAPEQLKDVPTALQTAGAWLRETQKLEPAAIGHRVVHGGPEYDQPILIDKEVLSRLERYAPLAPLHQPNNLAPIRALLERMPGTPQVACFDTAFHRTHDALADHYAIPQRFYAEGVRRYGFHGLSYEYVASRLPGRRARHRGRAGHRCASRQRRLDVRDLRRTQRRIHHGVHGARRAADGNASRASSIPASCSI